MIDAQIPMRDGIYLSAAVWLPSPAKKFPAILIRTPYNKSRRWHRTHDVLNFIQYFCSRGYAVIYQDVRGRGDSEGEFLDGDEGEDGCDTIDWILKQKWSNGHVAMMGSSFQAGAQWAVLKQKHPALKVFAPSASTDFHTVFYRGGAACLENIFWWTYVVSGRMDQRDLAEIIDWKNILKTRPLTNIGYKIGRELPLAQKFLQAKDITHDPVFGQKLDETDFANIKVPGLHITGWFDASQLGTLSHWDMMIKNSPASEKQHLIIGPWTHSQSASQGSLRVGEMSFTANSQLDLMDLHANFYDYYLKGEQGGFDFPSVQLYVTGANYWRNFKTYPPEGAAEVMYFLHESGVLNTTIPSEEEPDTYLFNPHNPAPSFDGPFSLGGDMSQIERRGDVLTYTSEELQSQLEIIGKVVFNLFAASTAVDTDFIIRLIDVHPDGKAIKLGPPLPGVMRARHRYGLNQEVFLTPGEIAEYKIELGHYGHVFKLGHRIRLEITSSAYPEISINQNTGNPIESDLECIEAHQTVYHNTEYPSALILPVYMGDRGPFKGN